MTQSTADEVRIQVRIAARPETVFSFFTDPAKMVRWKGRTADLDARPGGRYRVDVNGRDVMAGNYVEVTPYSRIVYTFGWDNPGNPIRPGSTTVEVTFVPDGDGTVVTLVHRGLPAPAREQHAMGWRHYLGRLVKAGTGGDPGPDPFVDPSAMTGH